MKIAIITSEPSGLPVRCLIALADAPGVEVGCVIYARESLLGDYGRNLRRKLRKAWRLGLGATVNGMRMRSWFTESGESLAAACERLQLPLHPVERLNSRATIHWLGRSGIQLGISAGTVFIGRDVRKTPPHGFINIHLDKLPDHRNGRSVLWSLYNGDPSTGISIHEVTGDMDGGAVLHRVVMPLELRPTVKDTVLATMVVIRDAVGPAIRHVCQNYPALEAAAQPQIGGATYTTPTLRQMLVIWRNHRRMVRENGIHQSAVATQRKEPNP